MTLPEKIVTERLVLRKPVEGDQIAIFRNWAQDTEVTRFLAWKPHASVTTTEEFIRLCVQRWYSNKQFPYVICLKDNGEIVGMIDAGIDGSKAEVGYVLAKAYWNKGYMTEALKVVVAVLLRLESIYRVYALCDIDNKASATVMQKAGMAYEGTLKKWGIHPNISAIPRNCLIYAKTK